MLNIYGKLNILSGDIVADDVLALGDSVVLPTNPMMRPGAGVSGAIFRKAGVDILEEYTSDTFGISYYNPHGMNEMKVGEVRITPGFGLKKDIIFAQGPKIWDYDTYDNALQALLFTYRHILAIAKSRKYNCILTPAIGTGEYGFEHKTTASAVVSALKTYSEECNVTVYLVLYTDELKALYQKYL